MEPSDEDKAAAPGCHEEVRDALDEDEYLTNLGIKSVLIGSDRRSVSIRRVKDVDVFCRLPQLPDVDPEIGPLALLNRFETALHDSYIPAESVYAVFDAKQDLKRKNVIATPAKSARFGAWSGQQCQSHTPRASTKPKFRLGSLAAS